MEKKKKKKLEFPTAITVLFIVLIFAAILTVVVPAGLYSKLSYNADSDKFDDSIRRCYGNGADTGNTG